MERDKGRVGKRIAGLSVGVALAFTGCATYKTVTPIVESKPSMRICEIAFPDPLVVPSDYEVTDQNDPEQLVKAGVNQSEKGRHGYAAEFFQMASGVPAPDNRLKTLSLFVAAREYLAVGNLKGFILTMSEVERNLDKFQLASLSNQEATLLALYHLAQGKSYSPGVHPEATHELFNQTMEE